MEHSGNFSMTIPYCTARLGVQNQPLPIAMIAIAAAKMHSAITTPHGKGS
jgi:hypothetical protein